MQYVHIHDIYIYIYIYPYYPNLSIFITIIPIVASASLWHSHRFWTTVRYGMKKPPYATLYAIYTQGRHKLYFLQFYIVFTSIMFTCPCQVGRNRSPARPPDCPPDRPQGPQWHHFLQFCIVFTSIIAILLRHGPWQTKSPSARPPDPHRKVDIMLVQTMQNYNTYHLWSLCV